MTLVGDMRLYAKLFLMIAIAWGVQRHAPPAEWGGDVWFGLRCHIAQLTDDHDLQMRLVDEYYQQHRTVEEVTDLDTEAEVRFHLAAG